MNQATDLFPTDDLRGLDRPTGFEEPAPVTQPRLVEGSWVSRSAPQGFEPEASTGPTEDELLDLTKDELYERAKEADIEGRSKMNKAELAAQLASH